MNWTSRNMKNPSTANNLGTIRGKYVSTHPSLLKMMYCGISLTCLGTMRVNIITENNKPENLNLSFENAYAAIEQDNTFPTMQEVEINREFKKKRPKVTPE